MEKFYLWEIFKNYPKNPFPNTGTLLYSSMPKLNTSQMYIKNEYLFVSVQK